MFFFSLFRKAHLCFSLFQKHMCASRGSIAMFHCEAHMWFLVFEKAQVCFTRKHCMLYRKAHFCFSLFSKHKYTSRGHLSFSLFVEAQLCEAKLCFSMKHSSAFHFLKEHMCFTMKHTSGSTSVFFTFPGNTTLGSINVLHAKAQMCFFVKHNCAFHFLEV